MNFDTLDVSDTPKEVEGVQQADEDMQPRKHALRLFQAGQLSSKDEQEAFAEKYIVDKSLLTKYLNHQEYLQLKKKKRLEKRAADRRESDEKTYNDYDWLQLFRDGCMRKLKVKDLNKYIKFHGFIRRLTLRKAEKLLFIQKDIAINAQTDEPLEVPRSDDEPEADSDSESDTDDETDTDVEDEVVNDTRISGAESETDENLTDSEDIQSIFTTTRSGRQTYSWRKGFYA